MINSGDAARRCAGGMKKARKTGRQARWQAAGDSGRKAGMAGSRRVAKQQVTEECHRGTAQHQLTVGLSPAHRRQTVLVYRKAHRHAEMKL